MARRHHKRHHHRRHNPLGFSRATLTTSMWGVAGAISTRALPQMFMGGRNTGLVGYGLNAVAALASSWAAGAVAGVHAQEGALVGGLIATGLRIVSDNFGKQVPFLAGDPAFHLGLVVPSYFPIPTKSDQYGRTMISPYPAPALPPAQAAAMAGMGYHRFRSRYQGSYGGAY